MLFGSIEILFCHCDIALEGIINRANRLVKEAGELDAVEYFFCSLEVALFQVFLNQAEWSDEEVRENAEYTNQIECEGRPETRSIVDQDGCQEGNDSDLEPVFNEEVVEFHGV